MPTLKTASSRPLCIDRSVTQVALGEPQSLYVSELTADA
jgi:hypothetical protein